jgi:hypothetical protein
MPEPGFQCRSRCAIRLHSRRLNNVRMFTWPETGPTFPGWRTLVDPLRSVFVVSATPAYAALATAGSAADFVIAPQCTHVAFSSRSSHRSEWFALHMVQDLPKQGSSLRMHPLNSFHCMAFVHRASSFLQYRLTASASSIWFRELCCLCSPSAALRSESRRSTNRDIHHQIQMQASASSGLRRSSCWARTRQKHTDRLCNPPMFFSKTSPSHRSSIRPATEVTLQT